MRHYYEWNGCLNMVSLPEIGMVCWQKRLKPPDYEFFLRNIGDTFSYPPLLALWRRVSGCPVMEHVALSNQSKAPKEPQHTSTIHDSSAHSHRQIIWPLLFISIHHQQAPVMIYCQRCKLGMERRGTEANGKWWLKTGQKIENRQVITAGGQGGTKNINASALLAEMSICSFILRV